jgi:nitric oxide reductase NorQ protein
VVIQKVLRLTPREDFVVTPFVESVCRRASAYLEAGYAAHFRGSAGTGKTTLAMHVASQRGRPVLLMFGDEDLTSSDLIGTEQGVHSTRVVDNFVRSVRKTEEYQRAQWADSRLTTACRQGYTLVYDEFSRSRADANNVLLPVLEEGILPLPDAQHGGTYMRVHPEFRAIFTSNPEDYAGVHKTQNALLDRMVSIELDYCDRDTEVAITQARAGIDKAWAEQVVDLVRGARVESGVPSAQRPTLRASIMIGRLLRQLGSPLPFDNPLFIDMCRDVLRSAALVPRDGDRVAPAGNVRRVIQAVS